MIVCGVVKLDESGGHSCWLGNLLGQFIFKLSDVVEIHLDVVTAMQGAENTASFQPVRKNPLLTGLFCYTHFSTAKCLQNFFNFGLDTYLQVCQVAKLSTHNLLQQRFIAVYHIIHHIIA